MAITTEIKELMNKEGVLFEVAEKVNYNRTLNAEEKEIAEIQDAWAREIGKFGKDPECTIAEFINRTVTEEVYNAPDELLDKIFERGSVGEFDDTEGHKDPKNTLVAHEAAKGGTVDRSYIDISVLKPTWKNRQVETDLSYADLRRNGFKSIATLTTFMKEACQNALFFDAFTMADEAVTGGEQVITVAGTTPTLEAMDALSLYLNDLNDRADNNVIVTLSKYAQAIRRMPNFAQYLSDSQKDDFNRYGLVKTYDGIGIASISGAKKTGTGSLLLPDKRIYGVAGKMGTLDMKGETHTYQDMNNQSEKVHIMLKDFTYGFMLTNIENFAKVTLQ